MKDYLRSWNERNYILFLVGINTGFRIGDILKLRVKDVQGWHIRVREQKTGKQKTIKMTRTLKNELRKYVEGKPLHHYLFQSRNGVNKPLDRRTVYWILKTAGNDLGIENIGTHTMRKTFGYHAWKQSVPPAMLMGIYNHSSYQITRRYLGSDQDDQDQVFEKIRL